jgi:hypothetical protein
MNFCKFSKLINYHFVLKPKNHEIITITYALLCALFIGCKSNAAKDQAFSCARGQVTCRELLHLNKKSCINFYLDTAFFVNTIKLFD